MKKTSITILVTVIIMVGVMLMLNQHIHPMALVVTNVSREADVFYITDVNGSEWCVIGAEDWECGDVCAVMFFDNFTKNIYDDVIFKVRYAGHL